MNKRRYALHMHFMTFTALNHWTILLLDITHWLANSRPYANIMFMYNRINRRE